MTAEDLEKWLSDVYSDMCRASDDDPSDQWKAFLDSLDPGRKEMHVEMHWGEGGVVELVDWLRDMVNIGEQRVVVDDPAWEDSSTWAVLAMDRRVLLKAEVVREAMEALVKSRH